MNFERLEEISSIIGSEKVEHLLKYVKPDQIIEMCNSIDLDAIARGDFDFGFEDDHKMFSPYLGKTIFIRPFQLYGKQGESIKTTNEFQDATIYFIAKRKKLRYAG